MLNKNKMDQNFGMNSFVKQVNNINTGITSEHFIRAHRKHIMEDDPSKWMPVSI